MATPSYTVAVKGKTPLVVLDLKKYDGMLDEIEELQDRLAVMERVNEPSYDLKTVVKKMDAKRGIKRDLK